MSPSAWSAFEVLRLLGAPVREDDLEYLSQYGQKLEYMTDDKQKEQFKGVMRDDLVTVSRVVTNPGSYSSNFIGDFVTIYFKKRRVVQIEVSSPRFKTKEGLSARNTANTWRKHFERYRETVHGFYQPSALGLPAAKHVLLFDDAIEDGITWRFGEFGNLGPDPDPDSGLDAVSVHAPGQPVIVDPDGGSRFYFKDKTNSPSSEYWEK